MFSLLRYVLVVSLIPFGFVEAGHYLTSTEIKNLISGRSMIFKGSSGVINYSGAGHWDQGGTIEGYNNYLGSKKYWTGTWYVTNNLYCRTLRGYGKTDFRCLKVEKINSSTIRLIRQNGTVSSIILLH